MSVRNRIKELRTVPANELVPSPENWRTHPEAQREALRGVLAEVGVADAVLARELDDGRLMLIDGHLRTEEMGEQPIPVLVLDVNEAEARKLLLTLDPLAAMAEADAAKLDALMRQVETGSEAVADLITDIASEAGMYLTKTEPANNLEDEWQGMPEFEQEAIKEIKLVVYFPDAATKARFSGLIGSTITDQTKFVWWPPESKPVRQSATDMVCESES